MARRILVAGGSGLLGSNICRMAAQSSEVYATYSRHETSIPGCTFLKLDVNDRQQVIGMARRLKPDIVINSIALVNVDYCEQQPDEAWKVNVEGAENLAAAAVEAGARFVHISTDSVFDGSRGMYREDDAPNPVNVYARSKLAAEEKIGTMPCRPLVIRTAFYGRGLTGTDSLAEWILSSLKKGQEVKGFTDVFFTPISAKNLARAILEMSSSDLGGVFHVAGSERCSKYEFARKIAFAYGLNAGLVQQGTIAGVALKAPRPRDISLDTSRVSPLIRTPLLNVMDGLTDYPELNEVC